MYNPKYTRNKKNGGVVPPVSDKRVLYVPVGCQTCIECKRQKARNWQVRLHEETRHRRDGRFITLTFSNEAIAKLITQDNEKAERNATVNYETGEYMKPPSLGDLKGYDLDNGIAIKAMRMFLERWRKKYKVSLRHWLVTELGHQNTENIHLHGIVWCDEEQLKELPKIWSYGYVWKGYEKNYGGIENYVNEKTVNYIIKYISKVDPDHVAYKSIVLCSPGIGRNYNGRYNRFNGENTDETYRTRTGHTINLPIYYRNKIYSDKQREILWLQKLDKNVRYIMGNKVAGDDTALIDNLTEYHRRTSRQLGYPPPEFIYKQSEYENKRRQLLVNKRLDAANQKHKVQQSD